MISEIRRDGKLRHARLILEQIKNLFQESPLEQDVQVQCSDGVVQTHCLILASISPTMKDYLHEVECSTIKEPLVILPDISKSEVTKFLDHILDQSAPDQKDSCDIKAACLALGVNPIPFEDVTEDRIKQVEENAEINDDHEIDDNSEATQLQPKPSPTKGRRKVRVVVSESPIGKKKEPRILSYSSFGRARKPTAKLESDDGSSSSNLSDDDSEEYDPDNRDLKISLEVKEPISTTKKPFERQVVGSGSLKCDFCPRTYHHVKAKNKHMLLDHKAACRSRGMYFPCKRCDMIFTSVTGRDKHVVRIHSNDLLEDSDPSAATAEQIPDLDWIKCPFSHPSGEDFFVLNVKEMRKHLKQVHPDKDNHCFVCGESCGSKKNLEQHIQAHQGAEGKILFGCEHCCQKFLSEYALIAHKRDSHSTAETFTCKYCQKPFR